MIRYALICDDGHGFDSWFRDSAAFDAQAAKGLINCPFCQSTQIARDVMAPSVARPRDDTAERLHSKLHALREVIIAQTEDVGDRFPQEARAIDEGEAKPRAIRGRASYAEAKALLEDGIEILPVPGLPSDGN